MATKLLDETRIREVHRVALDAGLAAHRADLLGGLDASFVASLPVSSSLSAQLFTDLHELSVALRDGSVLLVAWLMNALSLVGATVKHGSGTRSSTPTPPTIRQAGNGSRDLVQTQRPTSAFSIP